MKLRELVAMKDLRLAVAAAEPGLDADVTGAFTTDLLTPGRYLDGGELVLSSLMFRRGPADTETFVRDLVEHKVAGLAAGTASGPVPADLVEACERHGLPLLVVLPEVSFATIIGRILFRPDRPDRADRTDRGGGADGARDEDADRSADRRSADRRRRLVSAVAAGEGTGSLLAQAGADIGHSCTVLTAAGRQVAGAPIRPDLVPGLVHGYLTAGRLPHSPRSKPPFTVVAIGSQGRRVAGWFLAVPALESDLTPHQRDAVADLAEAVDLERSRREEGARVERRLADRLLHLLDEGRTGTAELEVALGSSGLLAGSQVVAVSGRRNEASGTAGSTATQAGGPELTRTVLEELLLTAVPMPVVATCRDDTLALAVVSAEDLPFLVTAIRAAAAGLAPGLPRERLAIGISGVGAAPTGLRGLIEEARQARQVAEHAGSVVSVMTRDDVDSHVLLLANLPDAVRFSYRQRLLGPLVAYDTRHRSELVHTLEAFLAHSGSWSSAAQELHLHVNTLRYRIGRIEQLTGRDLSRLEHQVDLFLALRSGR